MTFKTGNFFRWFNFGYIGDWGRLRQVKTPPNNSWVSTAMEAIVIRGIEDLS